MSNPSGMLWGVSGIGTAPVDTGELGVAYVMQTGVASDTELVTIGGRSYEFDTNAATTGDVAVDISGGAAANAAMTALATAINGDSSATVYALADPDNDATTALCYLVHKAADGTNTTLTTDGANTTVSAANFVNEAAPARKTLTAISYTITAQDVTTLAELGGAPYIVIGASQSTTQPQIMSVLVTTDGDPLDLTGANGINVTAQQVNSAWWVITLEDKGTALLSAADIVSVLLVA